MTKRESLNVETESKSIKKEDLLRALDRVKLGLSAKGMVETEFEQYLFMGDRIATCGEDVCIVVPFPIGFSCSVRANELYKLISGFTSDEILLEQKKGELTARSGKDSSFGLAYSEPGASHEMVKSLNHDGLKWKKLPKEVRDAIVLCSFSASKDLSKPELTGVHVRGKDVLSSDNYRISWYQLEKTKMEKEFLVPASGAVHLADYDLSHYSLTESWIHFKGEDVFFSIRLLGGEFPQKAMGFFPEKTKRGFELPKELNGILDKALVLLQDDSLLNKQVKLVFGEKEISCRVDKQDVGWFFESIPLKKGIKEKMEVEVNPIFLKEILKRSTEVVLVDENRMMFLSDNFKHLIALG